MGVAVVMTYEPDSQLAHAQTTFYDNIGHVPVDRHGS